MTHYQKLASMIFRIIGLILIIASFVLWIPALLINSLAVNPYFTLFSMLPYLVLGIILFAFSKFFAKWICIDIDKLNE